MSAFRTRFEAGRGFDLDDDLEFCPGLLTDEDVSSSNHIPSGEYKYSIAWFERGGRMC